MSVMKAGYLALTGQPVDLMDEELSEAAIMAAAKKFLEGVEAVTASAISAPCEGRYPVSDLDTALRAYYYGVTAVVGVIVHGVEGLEDDVAEEISAARDGLRVFAPAQWDRDAFEAAVRQAEESAVPGGLRRRWAKFSFRLDDHSAKAA